MSKLIVFIVILFSLTPGVTLSDPVAKGDYAKVKQLFAERFKLYSLSHDVTLIISTSKDSLFTKQNLDCLFELTKLAWSIPDVIRVDSLANMQHISTTDNDFNLSNLISNKISNFSLQKKRLKVFLNENKERIKSYISPDYKTAVARISVYPQDIQNYADKLNDWFIAIGEKLEGSCRNIDLKMSSVPTVGYYLISEDVELGNYLPWFFNGWEWYKTQRGANAYLNKYFALFEVDFDVIGSANDSILDKDYLIRLEKMLSWLRSDSRVVYVKSYYDTLLYVNDKLDSGLKISTAPKPILNQFLMLYELSLPKGLEFFNQVNVGRSSSLLTVGINITENSAYESFLRDFRDAFNTNFQ